MFYPLQVAGFRLKLSRPAGGFFRRRLEAYRAADTTPCDMSLQTRIAGRLDDPGGSVLRRYAGAELRQLSEGRRCLLLDSPEYGVWMTASFDQDYRRVELGLSSSCRTGSLTPAELEYGYTGAMFRNRVTAAGGLMLHSSALCYDGWGVAFSAVSGTGKSTHTRLWRECFGSDVTMIDDDRPVIRFDGDGAPRIWGTPWSGKCDLSNNLSAPLKAIVFLRRGEQNRFRPLEGSEIPYHLTQGISRPYYDETVSRRCLDSIGRLADCVPLYLLECTISREAPLLVRRELFS